MFDNDIHNNLLRSENSLIELTHKIAFNVSNANAHRHLFKGFLRRLNMIQMCRTSLHTIISENGNRPLGILAFRLSIYLNAYYLNMLGALDNLAWAATYEYGLTDPIIETKGKGSSRRFCNLFGKDFLSALNQVNDKVASILRSKSEWIETVKKIRDPAAHRVPPFFVGQSMTQDEYEESQRLREKSDEQFAKLSGIEDFDKRLDIHRASLDLLYESQSLGTFSPMIESQDADNHSLFWAPTLIETDQNEFLMVGSVVILGLFKNA